MGHEARARAEDGQIAAALLHLPELVVDDRFAQLVVADLQLAGLGPDRGILDARDLSVAPILEGLGRRGVVAVHIDDHLIPPSAMAGGRATLLARNPCPARPVNICKHSRLFISFFPSKYLG